MNNCYNKEIEGKFIRINDVISTIFEKSNDPSNIVIDLLNQIEYFKRDLINCYQDKIADNEFNLLSQKVENLENEAMNRLYAMEEFN